MDWAQILWGKRLATMLIKPKAAAKTSTETKSAPAPKPADKAKPVESSAPKQASSAPKTAPAAKEVVAKETKAKKKLFFMDAEYLAVILLLVIVLFGAKVYGFEVFAPDSVTITDKAVFTVDLVNDSPSAANVMVNFFSPAKSTINYPSQIAPNSTGKATITIYNNINSAQDTTATVEAVVGQQKIQKSVLLSFKENPAGSLTAAFAAFFSLPVFNEELASFGAVDWVIFWVLVIVAAVLIIAFVSRLIRRS